MVEPLRPHLLVVVAGTGTDIGKTWTTVRLAEMLRSEHSLDVAARKPAQSFENTDAKTDAALLATATGVEPYDVCPEHRWYPLALAPPMAADALAVPNINLSDLLAEVDSSWPGRAPDIGFVELAGGVRSPIAHDADGVDLTHGLRPQVVVVVADSGLGAINSVRLTCDALRGHRVIVLLNRFDDGNWLHRANRDWLVAHHDIETTTSVEELASTIYDALPRWCRGCGRPDAQCPGDCLAPLDVARHCPLCGRKVAVTITPTATTARCRVHGAQPFSA